MRVFTTSLVAVLVACAGPGQARLANTPTAHTKQNTGEAPPASGPDQDRSQQVNAMDDMKAAQNAHKEAADPAPPIAPKPQPAGTPGAAKPTLQPASPETK